MRSQRFRVTLAVLALAIGLGVGGVLVLRSPGSLDDLLVGPPVAPGPWMVDPTPWSPRGRPAAPRESRFSTHWHLPEFPAQSTLDLQSRGELEIRINGREVEGDPSRALRAGDNTIAFIVRRDDGPPALSLRWRAGDAILTSGEDWRVSTHGSVERPPRRPGDTTARPDPGLLNPAHRRTFTALRAEAPRLLTFAALAAALAFVALRWGGRWWLLKGWRRPEILLPLGVIVAWAALFLHNTPHLPLTLGFDAEGHLEVLDHLLRQGTLPAPSEGWQAYQPPLYYLLAAGLLRLLGLGIQDPGALWALRSLGWMAGVAQVLLLFGCLRLLFPGACPGASPGTLPGSETRDRLVALLGLGFAAVLPLHLYLYHYVSNEPLAATLSTLVVFLLLKVWRRKPGAPVREAGPSTGALGWRSGAVLGLTLGLALLAKVSAVLLLPVVVGCLLWRSREQGSWMRWSRWQVLATFVAIFVLTCGWHFGPIGWRYGSPLVGNWNPALGFRWWQDPGYRTLGDFLTFGRSLVEPWYAGFHGVADGLWSTLWLDGLAGGQATVAAGPAWDIGLMAVGTLLGLIPAAAALVGLWRIVGLLRRRASRSHPSRVAFVALLVLGLLTLGALYWMTLQVPSYAQAKAFYGQPALVVLVLLVAVGAERILRLEGRGRPVAWIFAGLFALWGLTAFAAAWIPATPAARVQEAIALRNGGDGRQVQAAERLLKSVLASGEDVRPEVLARAYLEQVYLEEAFLEQAAESSTRRDLPATAASIRAAFALTPDDPAVRTAMAYLSLRQGQPGAAEQHARRAVVLAPAEAEGYRALAAALLAGGRPVEAEEALRRLLAVAPDDVAARRDVQALRRAAGASR